MINTKSATLERMPQQTEVVDKQGGRLQTKPVGSGEMPEMNARGPSSGLMGARPCWGEGEATRYTEPHVVKDRGSGIL